MDTKRPSEFAYMREKFLAILSLSVCVKVGPNVSINVPLENLIWPWYRTNCLSSFVVATDWSEFPVSHFDLVRKAQYNPVAWEQSPI